AARKRIPPLARSRCRRRGASVMPTLLQRVAGSAGPSSVPAAAFDGAPPRRIRVPFLLDVVLVDDLGWITALDADPALTRVVQHDGPILNRLLSRRVARAFAIGRAPLPTFTDRTDATRARRQQELEARLGRRGDGLDEQPAELAALARYVRGLGDDI